MSGMDKGNFDQVRPGNGWSIAEPEAGTTAADRKFTEDVEAWTTAAIRRIVEDDEEWTSAISKVTVGNGWGIADDESAITTGEWPVVMEGAMTT